MDRLFVYGALSEELDFSDYRTVLRWERALSWLEEQSAAADTVGEQMRALTMGIATVFDMVFDHPDAANRVLGASTSIIEALEALAALTEFAERQGTALAGRWKELAARYAPSFAGAGQ